MSIPIEGGGNWGEGHATCFILDAHHHIATECPDEATPRPAAAIALHDDELALIVSEPEGHINMLGTRLTHAARHAKARKT